MKKVLIDSDPGHDDMIAIMLACASEELDILGITTIAGNQEGEKTFNNTLKILILINRKDILVARGFDKPILRDLLTAPEIHGISGLDGAELPLPEIKPSNLHAVDFIITSVLSSEEKVYLIPTGPLTNVGVAFLREPKIKENIEKIVLMGGAVFESNVTPAAEFNIYVDPEAAEIVFKSGVPIVMVGLDVTNKALFSSEDINKLERLDGRVSKIVSPLLRVFAKNYYEIYGLEGAPLHDALAVSYVIDRTILETKLLHVDIETNGKFTRGQTVVDIYGVTKKIPNVEIAFNLDLKKFKDLVFKTIKILDNR